MQEATTALTHSRTAALEFMGRTDAQVKVRGYRIEPGEIEAALRAIDGVRDCVVIAREDAPGETRLAAYFVGEVDNDGLRSILGRTLPEFMVPAAFVRMDRIPLTPNGKLDRAALPVPEASAGTPSSLPRNEVEERVAEVWKEVLGIEQVRVRDNFFDLGGSSLLLYRVFSRLRDLRADLRVVDLFRYSTVEELAGYLSAGSAGDEGEMAQSRSRGEERRNARRRVRG